MFFKTPSASFAAPHTSADLSATTADDNDTCALIPFPLLILKIKPCAISLTFFRKTEKQNKCHYDFTLKFDKVKNDLGS